MYRVTLGDLEDAGSQHGTNFINKKPSGHTWQLNIYQWSFHMAKNHLVNIQKAVENDHL